MTERWRTTRGQRSRPGRWLDAGSWLGWAVILFIVVPRVWHPADVWSGLGTLIMVMGVLGYVLDDLKHWYE